jgi:hypothetical protein
MTREYRRTAGDADFAAMIISPSPASPYGGVAIVDLRRPLSHLRDIEDGCCGGHAWVGREQSSGLRAGTYANVSMSRAPGRLDALAPSRVLPGQATNSLTTYACVKV